MAKRKAVVQSDEEEAQESTNDGSESEEEKKPLSKRAKPSRFAKKSRKSKSSSSDDEEGDNTDIHTSKDGEQYVDLGKRRRATVRTFKGNVFVDIREFYGEDGNEKPGKKGISLGIEQWENLKKSASAIDRMFAHCEK